MYHGWMGVRNEDLFCQKESHKNRVKIGENRIKKFHTHHLLTSSADKKSSTQIGLFSTDSAALFINLGFSPKMQGSVHKSKALL